MNLEDRKRVEHRCRALRRVGSVLVGMALLLATAFPPPPARAIAGVDDAVIAGLAAAFMVSCGIGFTVQNMDGNGVKEQIGRAIDQYVAETYEGITTYDWFTGNGHTAKEDFYDSGNLVIPAYQTNRLSEFVGWVRDKGGALYNRMFSYAEKADGEKYEVGSGLDNPGTVIDDLSEVLEFEGGSKVYISGSDLRLKLLNGVDKLIYGNFLSTEGRSISLFLSGSNYVGLMVFEPNGYTWVADRSICTVDNFFGTVKTDDESVSIAVADAISIPEPIADDQALVISAPAITAAPTLDDALQAILDAIAAGQLDTTKEITKPGEAVEPGEEVEPVEETFSDVAELGLPALGAALTSRFPFSIPWDVARAIKLLAAPAKAPYFEVDFMEPIAYRFGGFPGSTKIVLDFSEYEIIGQLTRWTSTIGFCLLLASGTKKLTWTA